MERLEPPEVFEAFEESSSIVALLQVDGCNGADDVVGWWWTMFVEGNRLEVGGSVVGEKVDDVLGPGKVGDVVGGEKAEVGVVAEKTEPVECRRLQVDDEGELLPTRVSHKLKLLSLFLLSLSLGLNLSLGLVLRLWHSDLVWPASSIDVPSSMLAPIPSCFPSCSHFNLSLPPGWPRGCWYP